MLNGNKIKHENTTHMADLMILCRLVMSLLYVQWHGYKQRYISLKINRYQNAL